jgi:hypothetical protein
VLADIAHQMRQAARITSAGLTTPVATAPGTAGTAPVAR